MAEDFSSIMRNSHFNQFMMLLSVPFHSRRWRDEHPKVPYWLLLEPLKKAVFGKGDVWPQYKQQAFSAFVNLLVALVEADDRFRYSSEDMDWFVEMLDSEHGQVMLAMLLAAASCKSDYLTPVQVAEATHTAESTWRNRCASGEILGAVKAGKQWLIPTSSIRAYGYDIEVSGETIEEGDIEQD